MRSRHSHRKPFSGPRSEPAVEERSPFKKRVAPQPGFKGHGKKIAVPKPVEETTGPTFAALLKLVADEMGLREKLDPEPAPLATLDYSTELKLKNATLQKFWTQHGLPDKPNQVIASPLPRNYRSTSKRRMLFKKGKWEWDFFLERLGGIAREDAGILEPQSHAAIYKFAMEKLNEPPYRALAGALNFLIVRGDPELMVIFNVFRLSADVVRKARLLAEHLEKMPGGKVIAAHVFFDASRSSYYIEAQASPGPFRLKKLFGPEFLPITVGAQKYFLHPTGFFQVNPSILPRVMEEVQNALKPSKADRFLDLYCGCGLFTLPIAKLSQSAVGVELSNTAVEAARQSSSLSKISNTRFLAGKIEPKRMTQLIPPVDEKTPEILLLDPPRQGTAPGLIHLMAERKPRRIAHLFCDLDVMPSEIGKWRKQGYMVAKIIPFDMFPGTNNLEVLVVLLPDKYGLLNRKPPPKHLADHEAREKNRENKPRQNKAGENHRSERQPEKRSFGKSRSNNSGKSFSRGPSSDQRQSQRPQKPQRDSKSRR